MDGIEITVATEYTNPLVISLWDATASIGWKRFQAPGQFKYEWIIEHLHYGDILELTKSLKFAAAMMETEE